MRVAIDRLLAQSENPVKFSLREDSVGIADGLREDLSGHRQPGPEDDGVVGEVALEEAGPVADAEVVAQGTEGAGFLTVKQVLIRDKSRADVIQANEADMLITFFLMQVGSGFPVSLQATLGTHKLDDPVSNTTLKGCQG